MDITLKIAPAFLGYHPSMDIKRTFGCVFYIHLEDKSKRMAGVIYVSLAISLYKKRD
jgi:hypothetical protein